jgi:cysteine synthase A
MATSAFVETTPYTSNPLPPLRHDSILSTIGSTPVVKLQRLSPPGVGVYVKAEALNPMGSVKDRTALGMIEYAEAHGLLKPGQTVVEASSGNTGLSLAMVCAAKGYPFVCVMSEAYSIERRKIMRFLGAKVVLTNPAHKFGGMLQTVLALKAEHGYYWPNQFENEANAWIHRQTTGREIVSAMEGLTLDWFVCAYGTGGTVKGVGQVLREELPETKMLLCEPSNAPVILSGVKTDYKDDGSITDVSHPVFRPHLMQGWTPDFVPRMVEHATEHKLYDELDHVSGDEAVQMSKDLARAEGIFTGTSGGGVLAVALRKAKSLPAGSSVLAMLPDTGERYLSTPLFDDVPADMTPEEQALFDAAPATTAFPQPLPEPNDEGRKVIGDFVAGEKVAIVAMESCEFCWTIFKLLRAIGVEYEALHFDALQYAPNNMGNVIRASVQELTGEKTFPQVFVGGKFFGGAADACIAWKKGELQPVLEAAGAKPDDEWNGYTGDPFEFLPKWMTKNPLRSK